MGNVAVMGGVGAFAGAGGVDMTTAALTGLFGGLCWGVGELMGMLLDCLMEED